jgi:methionyl-tRNA formyltransferase
LNKKNIVIATIKRWNIRKFYEWSPPYGYRAILITELDIPYIKRLKPQYIFFPHWSWKIPREIYENYKCVGFHETDLPFGRGGSPIQNLIIRGIYQTKISAIRIDERIDAGDIYLQRPIDISEGSVEDIFVRISQQVFDMINEIIIHKPVPQRQKGKQVVFKRRTPAQSEIPEGLTQRQLYDFIRMLDGEGYPRAFMKLGNKRIEFYNAQLKDNLTANVNIL